MDLSIQNKEASSKKKQQRKGKLGPVTETEKQQETDGPVVYQTPRRLT